ncbi:unnamed protein product [Sphagnum troendelagicum]|uniref:Strictosidine synthase conserved region domain-containing protein n=2 Tax=Sphagnum TaxID=13804 RepID=A0ABP0V2L4_9BRYO
MLKAIMTQGSDKASSTNCRSSIVIFISVVVLIFSWNPAMLCPHMDYDWSGWNASDLRPLAEMDAWPADPANKLVYARLHSVTDASGPESLAFDSNGGGPYTGVSDGRILFWNQGGWETFGVTSSVRQVTDVCNRKPVALKNEHICGRPLGLKFDAHGNLYIADAYFGLLVMSPKGGVAHPVSTQADGVAFKFTNDLDMDENGTVYFTDSSTRRPRRQCNLLIFEQERTGRLLKYEPSTQQTTVLAKDLYYPNGVAVAKDSTFLLVSLTSKSRIMKYWLKGPKAGSMEEFADVPGYPDNIHVTKEGDFWVALHSRRTQLQYFFANNLWLCKLLCGVPVHYIGQPAHSMVIKYNPAAEALDALEDRNHVTTKFLSYAGERDGVLWLSSVFCPEVWTMKLNKTNSNQQN